MAAARIVVQEELVLKLGNIVLKLSTDTDQESVPMLIAQLNLKTDMRDWSGLFRISLTLRVQVGVENFFAIITFLIDSIMVSLFDRWKDGRIDGRTNGRMHRREDECEMDRANSEFRFTISTVGCRCGSLCWSRLERRKTRGDRANSARGRSPSTSKRTRVRH